MFYMTDTNAHGLPHDPFKAIVSPRPIAWVGTRDVEGRANLGPYSFFNAVADQPKLVMFSSSGMKHSHDNIAATGVFTLSLVGRELAEAMNMTSAPLEAGMSEFDFAGLTAVDGQLVDAPFVGEAYAALECRLTEIITPKTLDDAPTPNRIIFGQVVGIHIREDGLTDGLLDMAKVRPLARMGYLDYCDGGETFQMRRPTVTRG
ncbi:flavin reductase family protein [Martelella alba]|uniref:Flavin reductase family protein n=1 Tax=Martelella alba TaxID=2590451 RepID=A0A506U642_9HYPH|nr:flavin reductase family protein [Martelella alba]TPW29823.1 flavin reductase family protein [Martelella alba]